MTSTTTSVVDADPAPELRDPIRHDLIGKLQLALPGVSMDSTTLACLWIADLAKLESFLKRAQRGGEDAAYISLFLNSNHCTETLNTCTDDIDCFDEEITPT